MIGALTEALRAASGRDLDDDAPHPERRNRKLVATVASIAFATLLLELLLTRMYPFFLGDVSSFVAIPVAMFGLSLGALALHLDRRGVDASSLPWLVPLLTVATLVSYVAFFFLFDHVFNLTHHQLQSPPRDALKTACLSLVFVPPFALAGVVLSVAFRAGAARVGRLYAADLAGSALACVATPIVLHFTDLPVVICLHLGVLLAANVALFSQVRAKVAAIGAAALALLTFAAARQWVFVEHPDPAILGVRYSHGHTVVEHAHRWNEVSRVALVSWEKAGSPTTWRVMHDDGVSNVVVVPWGGEPAPTADDEVHGLPALLDRPPRTALVLFAGAGRDMIRLVQHAPDGLAVTGVEINGLVPVLATAGGDPFHLEEFYARPDVSLVIDEGRAFLERDGGTYDLVFAGSNGAQQAVRTGHVRKFLDTAEATEAELDHLAPGGLLVFYVQPFVHKLEMLKRSFADRGLAPLADSAIEVGSRPDARLDGTDSLLVEPGGFSAGETARIVAAAEAQGLFVHFAPGRSTSPDLARRITSPPDRAAFVPTDDRPYDRPITLAGFSLFPPPGSFSSLAYSLDWIKIFTLLLFLALSVVTVGAFSLRRRGPSGLPLWAGAYFVLTGVCYMLAEIGLMAKLELFMGMPLYATAVVLAAFLLFNAAGSALVARRPASIALSATAAALLVPATLATIELGLGHLLWLPIALKAPLAVAAVAPLATVLGTFYPTGVELLAARGQGELVPMTFGLATLSAVVGSTFAFVAMIDVGFRAIVLWADAGYVVLALAAAVARSRR